jgi:hypothetical protein
MGANYGSEKTHVPLNSNQLRKKMLHSKNGKRIESLGWKKRLGARYSGKRALTPFKTYSVTDNLKKKLRAFVERSRSMILDSLSKYFPSLAKNKNSNKLTDSPQAEQQPVIDNATEKPKIKICTGKSSLQSKKTKMILSALIPSFAWVGVITAYLAGRYRIPLNDFEFARYIVYSIPPSDVLMIASVCFAPLIFIMTAFWIAFRIEKALETDPNLDDIVSRLEETQQSLNKMFTNFNTAVSSACSNSLSIEERQLESDSFKKTDSIQELLSGLKKSVEKNNNLTNSILKKVESTTKTDSSENNRRADSNPSFSSITNNNTSPKRIEDIMEEFAKLTEKRVETVLKNHTQTQQSSDAIVNNRLLHIASGGSSSENQPSPTQETDSKALHANAVFSPSRLRELRDRVSLLHRASAHGNKISSPPSTQKSNADSPSSDGVTDKNSSVLHPPEQTLRPNNNAINWNDVVCAANFPVDENDHKTLNALKRVLRHPEIASFLTVAEDILAIFANIDLYMEDITLQKGKKDYIPEQTLDFSNYSTMLSCNPEIVAIMLKKLENVDIFISTGERFVDHYQKTCERMMQETETHYLASQLVNTRTGKAFVLFNQAVDFLTNSENTHTSE